MLVPGGACILALFNALKLCSISFKQIIRTNQATELFGFNAFVGRLASILGPLMFSLITTFTGNQRLAIALLLPSLALGILLIEQIRLPKDS
jgi:MFS-type transporter involved in bile tolerance (Atg22 family)